MLAAASWLPVAAPVWGTVHPLAEIGPSPVLGGIRCACVCSLPCNYLRAVSCACRSLLLGMEDLFFSRHSCSFHAFLEHVPVRLLILFFSLLPSGLFSRQRWHFARRSSAVASWSVDSSSCQAVYGSRGGCLPLGLAVPGNRSVCWLPPYPSAYSHAVKSLAPNYLFSQSIRYSIF